MSPLLRLGDSALASPRAWLLGIALVTAGFALAIPRLELRTDGAALYPSGNETVRRTTTDRMTFHEPESLLVLVVARPEGPEVASPPGFELLRRLDGDLRRLAPVRSSGVRSLASLEELRISSDAISVAPYLDSLADAPGDWRQLVSRLRAHPLTDGTLLSPDGRVAALYVPRDETHGREALLTAVGELLSSYGDTPFELLLTGPLLIESTLGDKILDDLGRLVPIMVVVMSLLLWWLTGSLAGVLIPMTAVPVVLLWTHGAMALLGIPLTLVTTLLPVILMAITLTDEIHLVDSFRRHYESLSTEPGRPSDPRAEAVRGALRELEGPIVATSVTTATGFLAFAFTTLAPLRHFGLLSSFGILLAMGLTFTATPALLVTVPRRWLAARADRRAELPPLPSWEERALRLGSRGLRIGALFVLVGLVGISQLRVEDNWISNFAEDSATVTTHELFNDSFWGSHRFDLVLEASSGTFSRPAGVGLVHRLTERASRLPEVQGVVGYLLPLEIIARASDEPRAPQELPPVRLQDFLALAQMSEDPYELPSTLTPDASSVRIQLFLRSEDYSRDLALMQRLREILAEELPRDGSIRAHFSGDLPVGIEMVGSIVSNQLRSLGLAFGAVALLALLFFRSPTATCTVLAPVTASTVMVFGAMAFLGIPLGIATSMFAGLVMGVGVDFGCHVLYRYRHLRREGLGVEPALHQTFATTGRAIRANALVSTVGFSVLAFSGLRPNHTLGLLLAAALATSYAMTLLLMPGLLRRQKQGTAQPLASLAFSSARGEG